MGNDHASTALGRELGAELRRLRENAGLNGREMSHRLGCSQSKISRMETGARGSASETDITMYAANCRVQKKTLEHMLERYREQDDGFWMQSHRGSLPSELRSLVFQEATATGIINYEPMVVPGLLQTESYTCALFREGSHLNPDEIDSRVRTRLDRQEILRRTWPPEVKIFVHEQALRLPVGGMRIMHEQMLHLLFAGNRRHCTIRVVPVSAGNRTGTAGPFELIQQGEHKPVVYVENVGLSLFLENEEYVADYRSVLANLAKVALDEGQSREFLAIMASEYDRPEEDSDAPERPRTADLAHE